MNSIKRAAARRFRSLFGRYFPFFFIQDFFPIFVGFSIFSTVTTCFVWRHISELLPICGSFLSHKISLPIKVGLQLSCPCCQINKQLTD